MKAYQYTSVQVDGTKKVLLLSETEALKLCAAMTEDLGHNKPMEQKINFVPPPSLQKVTSPNESWIYISRKTGRLFRRTSHEYDAGKTFVFNALNMTWDIDDNHLWDSELLSNSLVLLDSIGKNDGRI